MTTLKLIDVFLQMKVVRWTLLMLVVVMICVSGWYWAANRVLDLQLQAEKGENAKYRAALDAQNTAIKKAGEDMAEMRKQAQEAKQRAAALKKQLEQRKVEIREVVLTGPCPDMVQQVLEEVRK